VKNIAESGTLGRLFNFKFGEIETRFLPETHDKDSLAMLWHKCCSINDPGLNRATELILQNSHYRAKGVALVVTFQVFYVLQQKRRRAMFREDVADAEEQISLLLVVKAVRPPE